MQTRMAMAMAILPTTLTRARPPMLPAEPSIVQTVTTVPDVHPNLPETCNGVDDNDGVTDGADAIDTPYFFDADTGGYGDSDAITYACTLPANHVTDASDCDDQRASVNPGQTEKATNLDDDCDGDDNDIDADGCIDHYIDADGDNFGETTSLCVCKPSGSYTALATGDCDDTRNGVRPNAAETCATIYDDDCDGDAKTSRPSDASCSTPMPMATATATRSSSAVRATTAARMRG